MKKILSTFTLVICAFAFGLGVGVSSVAVAELGGLKVAYVDTQKLLSSSKAIKQAESAKEKQTQEILKWYNVAGEEIRQQNDPNVRDALVKKYEAQLVQKRKAVKDAYTSKITQADNQMDAVITQKAKELGYDFVFKKESLLFGGTDITAHVLPLVK